MSRPRSGSPRYRGDGYPEGHGRSRSPHFTNDRRPNNQDEFYLRSYDEKRMSSVFDGSGTRGKSGGFRDDFQSFESRGRSPLSPQRVTRERLPQAPINDAVYQQGMGTSGVNWRRDDQGMGRERFKDLRGDSPPPQDRSGPLKRQRREMDDDSDPGFRDDLDHFGAQRYSLDAPRGGFGGGDKGSTRHSGGPLVIDHDHGREALRLQLDRASQERFRAPEGKFQGREDFKGRNLQGNWREATYQEAGRSPTRKEKELLTVNVDMNRPANQKSSMVYSSDRQLSLDLVNVGRQRLDFPPMVEHSGTRRETAMHSGMFAQEVVTLVHSVKDQYFGEDGVPLNKRFSALQKAGFSEDKTEDPTLDKRFCSNRGFNLNVNSLFDDEEPLFSGSDPKQHLRGASDLRQDLEKRKRERLEGVTVTVSGNTPTHSQRPLKVFKEELCIYCGQPGHQLAKCPKLTAHQLPHPVTSHEASDRLLSLRQGSLSVASYSDEFCSLATELGWDDRALQSIFLKGLNEALKDCLLGKVETGSLRELIAIAIKVDDRLRERRRERAASPTASLRPSQTKHANSNLSAASSRHEEPMHSRRSRLTQGERSRRVKEGLCIYCGQSGHILANCPQCPPQLPQPITSHEARDQLLSLRQGSLIAASYSDKFRSLATESDLDERALQSIFLEGLNEAVREQVMARAQTGSLYELMELATREDDRLRERHRDRAASPSASSRHKEPMQSGRKPLTPDERARRYQEGLCIYCGEPGHMLAACPQRRNPSTQQLPQPITSHEARDLLLSLRQGSLSAASYSDKFRSLATELDLDNRALESIFLEGLNEAVRERVMGRAETGSLEEIIALAIKVDDRLRERRRERAASPSASSRHKEPMQSGRKPLTPDERARRYKEGLCMYCGEPGHMLAACPQRMNPSTQQLPQPITSHEARDRLLSLRQGSLNAASYSDKFRILAAELGWDDGALESIFLEGLNEAVREQVMGMAQTGSLYELMELATREDDRLRERRRDRAASPSASSRHEEPMQSGRSRLTPDERSRRIKEGLCIYCGQSGHILANCPQCPPQLPQPISSHEARDQLLSLRQGSLIAASYSDKFRSLATESDLDDRALQSIFLEGLHEAVRQRVEGRAEIESLEELIALAIKVDDRLRERRRERAASPSASSRHKEPMQSGRKPLTPDERARRYQEGLCIYCGEPGHMLVACPQRINPSTQQLPQPITSHEARDRLLSLRQGSLSAASYSDKFCSLAAELDLDDGALESIFLEGLHEAVREQVMGRAQTGSLYELMELATREDDRLRERHRERAASPSASSRHEEPMQSGRKRLTPDERRRRKEEGLCIYCGEPGHRLAACPQRSLFPQV